MSGQAYLSKRSLTQGLDIINMEPSAPGVRTSVINSYLSNTNYAGLTNASNASNALISTLATGSNSVQSNIGSNSAYGAGVANPVGSSPAINSGALTLQSEQNLTVLSPKIYSVIKNSITQALNAQMAISQSQQSQQALTLSSYPSSNINALLSDQVIPGSMVNAAGAQINSFVNTLVHTVQSHTDLSVGHPSQMTDPGVQFLSGSMSGPMSGSSNSTYRSSVNNDTYSSSDLTHSLPSEGVPLSINIKNSSMGGAPANSLSSSDVQNSGSNAPLSASGVYGSSPSQSLTTEAQGASQNLQNSQGWVVGRIYSSVQSMIEMLTVNQAQNAEIATQGGMNNSIAALDSLIQSANSLFTSMGLSSTVTASTLQTALQEIQRNLMAAPAQGQWVSVVA